MVDLRARVSAAYAAHAKTGTAADGFAYHFTCPNPGRYPHQWFWDSCFHVVVQCRLGALAAATRELETLLHRQRPSGFIGHMVYWDRGWSPVDWIATRHYPADDMSPLIQPAFLAHALERVHALARESGAKAKAGTGTGCGVLARFLDPVVRYYDAVFQHRAGGAGRPLLAIIHPWESGMDNSPQYDPVLGIHGRATFLKWMWHLLKGLRVNARLDWDVPRIRARDYFVVEDVLVNVAFADGLFRLGRLAAVAGRGNLADRLEARARSVEAAILSELYDPDDGFFYARFGADRQRARVKTVAGFAPLNLPHLPAGIARRVVAEHLRAPGEFWTAFPLPSVARDEPAYDPTKSWLLWRGPTWISTNWYALAGLAIQERAHGDAHGDIYGDNDGNNDTNNDDNARPGADSPLIDLLAATRAELRARTLALAREHGLWEHYHPETGGGFGAENLGWAGLVLDL